MKIIKIVASRCHILKLKCTKFDFGWGSAPDPVGGAYSAPQDPLAAPLPRLAWCDPFPRVNLVRVIIIRPIIMQHLTLLNTPCVGHKDDESQCRPTLDSLAQLTAGLVDIMHLLLVSGDVNLLNVMPTSQFTPPNSTSRRAMWFESAPVCETLEQSEQFVIYRVGQKSKLLILSEYVNKTEKLRGTWTYMNTATDKRSIVWYFHVKYFTSWLFYV